MLPKLKTQREAEGVRVSLCFLYFWVKDINEKKKKEEGILYLISNGPLPDLKKDFIT